MQTNSTKMLTKKICYRGNKLHCEDIPLAHLAEEVGTPCYVYSENTIIENYRAYSAPKKEVDHEIRYSVKANSSLALLAREGSGFDIVSGGELFRVLRAGGNPAKIVFSGVGKTREEIEYALRCGVGMFNCESEIEANMLAAAAKELDKHPKAGLRVNPDINIDTHPYIATGMQEHKFGIPIKEAEKIYGKLADNNHLNLVGISCHIGSQIFENKPFLKALSEITLLAKRLQEKGIAISHLDLGGGLAVAYRSEETQPLIKQYIKQLANQLYGTGLHLVLEPGRSIVGPAGVLLTKVLYRKQNGEKEFVIVDAAMNDLIRPSLYNSHHEIVPLTRTKRPKIVAEIVGPICETGDFLARGREVADVKPDELLAICTAGAYGFVLSSNYNARPRPAEVLVQGKNFKLLREREEYDDLIRGESL